MRRKTRTRRGSRRVRRVTNRVRRGRRVRGGFTFPNMNIEAIKQRVKQEVENAKQEVNMVTSKANALVSQANSSLSNLKNNYQSAIANMNQQQSAIKV